MYKDIFRIKEIFRKIYSDSLLKNSIYLIATNFFSLILGFFFWMVATRYYTPKDIGIVSAILSSIFLISMISSLGLPMSMIFYLPKYSHNANRIINSSLIINIVISLVVSLIYLLGIGILVPALKSALNNFELIFIFIITAIMTSVSSLMTGIYTAGKRSSFHMIKENIFSVIKIFLLISFASLGTIGIFLSWSIGLVVTLVIGFYLLSKLWKYYPMIILDPIIKDMAGFSLGNYISMILYSTPRYIFPIMIVSLISPESAGYFFIAMTIAGLLHSIPYSLSSSFLAESNDKNRFWNNVNKAIKFNMALLIPGILLFLIFGKFVLNIFNPNYADNSYLSLIILSMAGIPISLIAVFCMIRNAQKKVGSVIKVNIILSLMIIILSVPLMKILGIEGAAISYLISTSIMAVIIIYRMKNPIETTIGLIRDKNFRNLEKIDY